MFDRDQKRRKTFQNLYQLFKNHCKNFNDIYIMSQGHILFTGTQTEACIVER